MQAQHVQTAGHILVCPSEKQSRRRLKTTSWLSSGAKATRTRNVCAALLQSFGRQFNLGMQSAATHTDRMHLIAAGTCESNIPCQPHLRQKQGSNIAIGDDVMDKMPQVYQCTDLCVWHCHASQFSQVLNHCTWWHCRAFSQVLSSSFLVSLRDISRCHVDAMLYT